MPERFVTPVEPAVPRPIPASYWLVPGRLLVGEYPGSQSRAEAMERLRQFLQAGVTCFVDVTEPAEMPSYESLLPFATPDGRRVEYLREPIPDHGIPEARETMERAIGLIDDALAAGHVVYLHCRAGVGRSATVAGCWLASRPGRVLDAYEELQRCWRQSSKSLQWDQVPETSEQEDYVRGWTARPVGRLQVASSGRLDLDTRARGALLGLAVGDAVGSMRDAAAASDGRWTQHTALTLCLAESLLDSGRFDARDQIERYVRWQREGHLTATGRPATVTPDVAKALANYQWRGQPMAGSHDPRDRTTAALPRTIAAVIFSVADPEAAVQLAGECARTTHQSPLVLDSCRYYGAMLAGALRAEDPRKLLHGLYEPVPGLWDRRPLKPAVAAMARANEPPPVEVHAKRAPAPDIVAALARARAAVASAMDFEDALQRACDSAVEPGLEAALAGTLMGSIAGPDVIPRERLAGIARVEVIESSAARLARAGGGGRT
jgi:ADP-ribosylglycohydrolase